MKNSDILRIFSPLAFFVFHVLYLIAVSKEPFFNKWIDGSFTFFVALVLCNVIRSRIVSKASQSDQPNDTGRGQDNPENHDAPT
jgi:uncharacterized membrane protein